MDILFGGGTAAGLAGAFVAAAALVVCAGLKLGAYGDALGERTGFGKGLIGLVFLAGVTSLPELVVSTTSAVAASLQALALEAQAASGVMVGDGVRRLLQGGADLAVGNMVGSNVFNLMILVLIDLLQGKGALMYRLSRKHILTAGAGLALLGVLLFGYALCHPAMGGMVGWVIPVLGTGPVTPLLFVGYVAAMWGLARHDRKEGDVPEADAEAVETDARLVGMSAGRFYGMLSMFALLIVVGGIWLSRLGDRMAQPVQEGGFGLGAGLIGTIFLAISTSLPEIIVSYSAVRIRAYDMAVGNVLGSNLFNLAILFTSDIGLRGGSLLAYASTSHLMTVAAILVLTSLVIVGLVYRTKREFAWLGYDVWLMVGVYVLWLGCLVMRDRAEAGGVDGSAGVDAGVSSPMIDEVSREEDALED